MEWLTLLPPTIAIIVAVWKKDVIIALLSALFTAEFLHSQFNIGLGFLSLLDRIIKVFSDAGNTRVLVFSLMIGALLALMRKSGGVSAFVQWVSSKGLAKSQRRVSAIPTLLGILIFIETNLSILTAGFISRQLFDKVKMSRARLAYIIDSTCAPICVIILFNAWGATILGLISGFDLPSPAQTLAYSVPYNLYSWFTLILVFFTVWTGKVFGPMKESEKQLETLSTHIEENDKASSAHLMVLPLLTLIVGIIFFMWYTGDGQILQGSGSTSVLWAVGLACLMAVLLIKTSKAEQPVKTLINWSFEGMSDLLPLVTTVLLALALGDSMKALGTGDFVSQMVTQNIPLWTVPALIFIAGALISFTTGTSWGTFSILIPIGVPIALAGGLPVELVLAAILGGSVFGDHCSPISDTTIVSSLAAGCDHLEHVKTQLPYALAAGVLSISGFLLFGLLN
ncbi:Na+/H+ antiporter NhaC family protein [Aliikangiella sp. G2MR2-5]|uniref:Na+/H+ antiporter NhaC family protein n=1 Tax=Aliikangiella sp. G2MR2-5 TaxID=2788943 RepID=UPI0018AA49F4|nr:Na+/H+ antiporter NhaC family protein [Aliikangiella sp. G2MR2-5]